MKQINFKIAAILALMFVVWTGVGVVYAQTGQRPDCPIEFDDGCPQTICSEPSIQTCHNGDKLYYTTSYNCCKSSNGYCCQYSCTNYICENQCFTMINGRKFLFMCSMTAPWTGPTGYDGAPIGIKRVLIMTRQDWHCDGNGTCIPPN